MMMEDLFPQKKTRFVFDSCQTRNLFPYKMPPNRMGNEMMPIRGSPHLAPGHYENEEKTNMIYQLQRSGGGSTQGVIARNAPRFQSFSADSGLGPGAYELKDQFHELTRQAQLDKQRNRPAFLSAGARFPVFKRDLVDVNPSPGMYEHEVKVNRQVKWGQSFGGTPTNLPSVSQQSTLHQNTDKLMSTGKQKKFQRKLAYLNLYY